MPEWLPIAGVVMLFLVIAGVALTAEKRRSERLRAVAQELGLGFERDGDALASGLGELHLVRGGRHRGTRNVMRGAALGGELVLFDHSFVSGSARERRTHHQTVAAFRFPGAAFPELEVAPETFLHKVVSAVGYQDLDFAEDPEFS